MRMLLCLLSLLCLLGTTACSEGGNPPPINPDGLVDGATPDGGAGDMAVGGG